MSQVHNVGSSEQQVCYVRTIPTDTIVDTTASRSPVTTSLSCNQIVAYSVPISARYVNNVAVTVQRDTGCSGIVVRRSKIQEENLIKGKKQMCVLADGSRIKVPVAEVFSTNPFLKGQCEVWCMGNPVYDLIVGNVPDAKPANQPDPEWQIHGNQTAEAREG